jgi:hypothetical protein
MLGPGVPDPPRGAAGVPKSESRHRLAAGALVLAKSILGGLHHEYSLAPHWPDRIFADHSPLPRRMAAIRMLQHQGLCGDGTDTSWAE